MARKKGLKAAEISFSKDAAAQFRQQTPIPVFCPISPPLPPKLPYNELRKRNLTNLRTTVEASLAPLPQDDEMDFPLSPEEKRLKEMEDWRRLWADAGYYANHPNHNIANASEDQLREILQSHPKLGPALKQYKLFINPPKMHSLLLQFPNRNSGEEYRAATGTKPLELRIKPKCGIVELDIPLNIHRNYDKEKGILYGKASRNSRVLQDGGSFGFAGGMGVGSKPFKDDKRAFLPEGPSTERLLDNFDDANNKGHVMNKIILGGKIVPFQEGDPIYVIATFKDDICTWTRLDAMVQLSPQFNHIDALHESDKPVVRKSKEDEGDDEDQAAHKPEDAEAKSEETDENEDTEDTEDIEEAQAPSERKKITTDKRNVKPDENEAKAVNMSVKSAEKDEDEGMYGGMRETAKLLTAMRDEPWQRLEWIDQDEPESYQIYDENLVYQDPEHAPHLVSEMTNEQYLDAISCPRIHPLQQAANDTAGMGKSTANTEAKKHRSSLNLDDTEDEKEQDELLLPPGITRPDGRGERVKIEVLCRSMCSRTSKSAVLSKMEAHFRQKTKGTPTYRFLDTHNHHHRYFKWRLAENQAGRGYSPEDDLPKQAANAAG